MEPVTEFAQKAKLKTLTVFAKMLVMETMKVAVQAAR